MNQKTELPKSLLIASQELSDIVFNFIKVVLEIKQKLTTLEKFNSKFPLYMSIKSLKLESFQDLIDRYTEFMSIGIVGILTVDELREKYSGIKNEGLEYPWWHDHFMDCFPMNDQLTYGMGGNFAYLNKEYYEYGYEKILRKYLYLFASIAEPQQIGFPSVTKIIYGTSLHEAVMDGIDYFNTLLDQLKRYPPETSEDFERTRDRLLNSQFLYNEEADSSLGYVQEILSGLRSERFRLLEKYGVPEGYQPEEGGERGRYKIKRNSFSVNSIKFDDIEQKFYEGEDSTKLTRNSYKLFKVIFQSASQRISVEHVKLKIHGRSNAHDSTVKKGVERLNEQLSKTRYSVARKNDSLHLNKRNRPGT